MLTPEVLGSLPSAERHHGGHPVRGRLRRPLQQVPIIITTTTTITTIIIVIIINSSSSSSSSTSIISISNDTSSISIIIIISSINADRLPRFTMFALATVALELCSAILLLFLVFSITISITIIHHEYFY